MEVEGRVRENNARLREMAVQDRFLNTEIHNLQGNRAGEIKDRMEYSCQKI